MPLFNVVWLYLVLIKHLLYARPSVKSLIQSSHKFYPPCTDGVMEANNGSLIFSRSYADSCSINMHFCASRDLPGSPVVKAQLQTQGAWVQSLVGNLRSHMLRGVAKEFKKIKGLPTTPETRS